MNLRFGKRRVNCALEAEPLARSGKGETGKETRARKTASGGKPLSIIVPQGETGGKTDLSEDFGDSSRRRSYQGDKIRQWQVTLFDLLAGENGVSVTGV
jgi:hypothetical protein